jgi:hypothetical protein
MEDKECVSFLDYDKVSDILMYFGSDTYLKFNVSLARKSKATNKRFHYLKEFRYDSGYQGYGEVVMLRRQFDFYLEIDVVGDFNSSIMIRAKDIMNLRVRLKMVAKWFSDGVFKMNRQKKLFITGNPEPVIVTNLTGKYIKFEPAIYEYKNGDKREGVRMTLNDSKFVDYTVDTFMEFAYLINSINMYEAALSIVNYIPTEFGNDIIDVKSDEPNDSAYIEEEQCDANIKKSVTLSNKLNKSFFDTMDDI